MKHLLLMAACLVLLVAGIGGRCFADEGQKASPAVSKEGAAGTTPASEAPVVERCPKCGAVIETGHGKVDTCPKCGAPLYKGLKGIEKEVCAPAFTFGTSHAFLSKYVARGAVTTEDPVYQPSAWASYKGLTLNVWCNVDLTDVNDNECEFNEADTTLDYTWTGERFCLSSGLIRYEFPNTGAHDTTEVYGGVALGVLLKPTLTVYYDFQKADGFYGNFSLSHSVALPQVVDWASACIELAAVAGAASTNYNNYNFGSDHTAFTDLVLTADLPITIAEHYTLKPVVSYSTVLDRTIRTKNSQDDNVTWGAVVSASY